MLLEIFIIIIGIGFSLIAGHAFLNTPAERLLALLAGSIIIIALGAFVLGESLEVYSGFDEVTNETNNITDWYNATGSKTNTTEITIGNTTRSNTYTEVYGSETDIVSYILVLFGIFGVALFIIRNLQLRSDNNERT